MEGGDSGSDEECWRARGCGCRERGMCVFSMLIYDEINLHFTVRLYFSFH